MKIRFANTISKLSKLFTVSQTLIKPIIAQKNSEKRYF